jgi:hypothetical protein
LVPNWLALANYRRTVRRRTPKIQPLVPDVNILYAVSVTHQLDAFAYLMTSVDHQLFAPAAAHIDELLSGHSIATV